MNIEQFNELLTYIKENNSWGDNIYEVNVEKNRKAIKYVDSSFDSRDGMIWFIKFRGITGETDKEFRIEKQEQILDIYRWLDEPLNK